MQRIMKVLVFFLSLHTLACAMTQNPLPSAKEIQQYEEAASLIEKNENLDRAEELLDGVKNHLPIAYKLMVVGLTQQYEKLLSSEYTPEAEKQILLKIIDRSKDAISHGYPEIYNDLGFAYERLGNYQEAINSYKAGLPYASKDKMIYVKLGILLRAQEPETAVKYYKIAADAGNERGIYYLALSYATGIGAKRNPKEASVLYKKLLKDESSWLYPAACNILGLLSEEGLNGKADLKEAEKYFTKAKNATKSMNTSEILGGEAHLARLIVTNKIAGDKTQALEDLKSCAESGEDIALYLYSAILINQGELEEAMKLLKNAYIGTEKPKLSLIPLQLGLAYLGGWGGLPEDKKTANEYFKFILNEDNKALRSYDLARAYLYIMGIGVEKDEQKGFQFLKESKTKIDDVFLDTYQLFPALKTLEEEYNRKQAEQLSALIEQEEQQKQKDAAKKQVKKGKGPATQPAKKKDEASKSETPDKKTSAGESSASAASRLRQRSVWDVSKDEWNSFWAKEGDGSSVSEVKRGKNQIIIDDPERNEKLIVTVSQNPYRHFDDLRELIYDPRIAQRQKDDDATKEIGHNFAKILDYVIQCTGTLGQFAKAGSDQPKDQIIANVTRVNKKTGKETPCKAEYTFYEKNGKPYLYHRLLRPIAK